MFVRLKCSSPNGCLPETISTGIREVKKKFGTPNFFLIQPFKDKNAREVSHRLTSRAFLSELEEHGTGTDTQGADHPIQAEWFPEHEVGDKQAK